MKKKTWLLFVFGSIFLLTSASFCCLLIIQLGSEYQIGQELLNASDEAYLFNPQEVLSDEKSDLFVPIPFPEKFSEFTDIPVAWKQEEYFRVANLFMKTVLYEQIEDWRLNAVTTRMNCTDFASGQIVMRGISIELFREIASTKHKIRQDLHLSISPSDEMIRIYRREYYPYEILDYIEWSKFRVSADQAIMIAEKNGGTVVRVALNNNCTVSAHLTAGIQKNDWWIYYEPINEPSVFEIAVDEQTGKRRILREFQR